MPSHTSGGVEQPTFALNVKLAAFALSGLLAGAAAEAAGAVVAVAAAAAAAPSFFTSGASLVSLILAVCVCSCRFFYVSTYAVDNTILL